MPADLDQSGRDRSHGAVIGGEGLVELCHDPTNGGFAVCQIDLDASRCQIESGRHPANSAADDQCGTNFFSVRLRLLHT